MKEIINITKISSDGKRTSYEWFVNDHASIEDCYDNHIDFTDYILDCVNSDDRFNDAAYIEAEAVVYDGEKLVSLVDTCIERGID